MPEQATVERPTQAEEVVLAEVLRALRSLQFGSVQIIVQNGAVVQIDTLEKKRFDRG